MRKSKLAMFRRMVEEADRLEEKIGEYESFLSMLDNADDGEFTVKITVITATDFATIDATNFTCQDTLLSREPMISCVEYQCEKVLDDLRTEYEEFERQVTLDYSSSAKSIMKNRGKEVELRIKEE